MNKALTEHFLELVPAAQRQEYRDILVRDPNCRFETTFAYFYDNYEEDDEIEIENNKDKMKAEWHPRDGFEVLKQRIKDGTRVRIMANNTSAFSMRLDFSWVSGRMEKSTLSNKS